MVLLMDVAGWLLAALGGVVILGLLLFAVLAWRLRHPPRD